MEQIKKFLNNKTILITGASGSVGSSLIDYLIDQTKLKKIIAVDNDEGKLFFQMEKYKKKKNFSVALVDICDFENLEKIFINVDYVLHCAAYKNVPMCETSPSSCIKVNIDGTSNVIQAAVKNNVKKVIFTSSDKAVNPTNIMGTSKLIGEKLITAANITNKTINKTIFSSTRFGNVVGSTGSVLPIFENQLKNKKKITITSKDMTRFMMSKKKSVELVLSSLAQAKGGEIFITKMPCINIFTFAQAFYEKYTGKKFTKKHYKLIGFRQGEKMYEELMYETEINRSYETKDFFIVYPDLEIYNFLTKRLNKSKNKKVKKLYNSHIEKKLDFVETKKFISNFI